MSSQRETHSQSQLHKWRGVDQRTQPTLVEDGFFVMTRGIFFGLGDNAERLPGKVLSGFVGEAVFGIYQFGQTSFIQTVDRLWIIPTSELVSQFVVTPPVVVVEGEEEIMSQALLEYHAAAGGVVATSGAGTWQTVPISHKISDPDSIAVLASNKITLAPGTYRWKSYVNFLGADRSKTRLYNVTAAAEIKRGMNALGVAGGSTGMSICQTRFTLVSTSDLRLEYIATSNVSEGLLHYAPFPSGSESTETGAQIEILKEP